MHHPASCNNTSYSVLYPNLFLGLVQQFKRHETHEKFGMGLGGT